METERSDDGEQTLLSLEGGNQLAARERIRVAPVTVRSRVVVDAECPGGYQIERNIRIIGQRRELQDIRSEREVCGSLARRPVEQGGGNSIDVDQVAVVYRRAGGLGSRKFFPRAAKPHGWRESFQSAAPPGRRLRKAGLLKRQADQSPSMSASKSFYSYCLLIRNWLGHTDPILEKAPCTRSWRWTPAIAPCCPSCGRQLSCLSFALPQSWPEHLRLALSISHGDKWVRKL